MYRHAYKIILFSLNNSDKIKQKHFVIKYIFQWIMILIVIYVEKVYNRKVTWETDRYFSR